MFQRKGFVLKAVSAIFTLCFFACFAVWAEAAEVTMDWTRPNDPAVSGYRIYYGPAGSAYQSLPQKFIDSADTTRCQISGLEIGKTYAFTATSVNPNGNESDFADIISYTVPDIYGEYAISAGAEGGGAVMLDTQVGIHEGVIYTYGETVELTAVPDKGHVFISWQEDGEVVSTQKEYIFTAQTDRNLTAEFRRIVLSGVMMLLLE